jgi:hypothetical protein
MNKKCLNYILRNTKNLKIVLFIISMIILLLIIEMNVYSIINSLVYYDGITTLVRLIKSKINYLDNDSLALFSNKESNQNSYIQWRKHIFKKGLES